MMWIPVRVRGDAIEIAAPAQSGMHADWLNQLCVIVFRGVNPGADFMGDHQAWVVWLEDAARFVSIAVQPRIAILFAQDRWHAVRVVASVVNLSHEIVRRHSDVDAAFNGGAVRFDRPVPEACEGEHRLIDHGDIERRLAAFVIQVPLEKALCNLQAPLSSLPRAAIAGGGFNGLDSGVDRRVFWRLALGKERNQTPANARSSVPALDRANDRDTLRWRDIEARRELPLVAHEIEFALDRSIVRGYVAATHTWILYSAREQYGSGIKEIRDGHCQAFVTR